MGRIPFPPPPAELHVSPIPKAFTYGEELIIEFGDTCYFTASNQHTFMPILPTGNFVAETELGPYYAVPENNTVLLTSFDEATRDTYQYEITVAPSLMPGSPLDEDPPE